MTDTFTDITSTDVRPGETNAQARTRRKTEQNRLRRQAAREAAGTAPTPRKKAAAKADAAPKAPPADPVAAAAEAVRPAAKGPGKPSTRDKRAHSVVEVTTVVGTVVAIFNEADGVAIIDGGPKLGEALAKVADRRPMVAKVLDGGIDTAGYVELAIAVAGIAVPIARNHGLFGGSPAPAVPPQPAPAWGVVDDFGVVTPMPATVTPEGGFQAQPDGQAPASSAAGYVPPTVPEAYAAEPWNMPFVAKA